MAATRRTGRRSKATDPRISAVVRSLRAGNTRRASALFAGIDPATFYRWLADDKPLPGPVSIGEDKTLELPPNATFRDAVEKAEADVEVRAVTGIISAASPQLIERIYTERGETIEKFRPGAWQALAWWLERRRRDDFPRPATQLTGKDGGPIETRELTDGLDDHEKDLLRQLVREVAEAEGDAPPDDAGSPARAPAEAGG